MYTALLTEFEGEMSAERECAGPFWAGFGAPARGGPTQRLG